MNGAMLQALAVWRSSERTRFIAIGIGNTAFGYACFAILFLVLERRLPLFSIQIIAHLLSVSNAFIWHRCVTFRSTSRWIPEFLRFNVSYLGALGFGLVVLPLLVKSFRISPIVAAPIVMSITVLLSYLFHRRFSFQAPNDLNSGDSSMR